MAHRQPEQCNLQQDLPHAINLRLDIRQARDAIQSPEHFDEIALCLRLVEDIFLAPLAFCNEPEYRVQQTVICTHRLNDVKPAHFDALLIDVYKEIDNLVQMTL